jgi:SAM-dependent methyltransferase
MINRVEDVYQYAEYYDILFGWDRSAEAFFYDAAFQKHGLNPGGGLLEIGCGTGQVGIRMARLGWSVTGLDLKPGMLAYMQAAAEKSQTVVEAVEADITDFKLDVKADGAFCPLGTIGHLPDDEAVVNHFRALAANLNDGAIYFVDAGFVEGETAEWDYREDSWQMSRGRIMVSLEDGVLHVTDHGKRLEIPWDARLRQFNCEHFAELVKESGAFEILTCYPEADVTEDGISIFDIGFECELQAFDRAIIALRKI